MVQRIVMLLFAFAFTLSSAAWINPQTDERAMYGLEGPIEYNWKPREVAGWPAPFLADSPNTSVLHQVGPEDVFRAGPFIASWSFWLVVVLVASRLLAWLRRRK